MEALIKAFAPIVKLRQIDKQMDLFSTTGTRSNEYECHNLITDTHRFYASQYRPLKAIVGVLEREMLNAIKWFIGNRQRAYDFAGTEHISDDKLLRLDNMQDRDMTLLKTNMYNVYCINQYLKSFADNIDFLMPGINSRSYAAYQRRAFHFREFVEAYDEDLRSARKSLGESSNFNHNLTRKIARRGRLTM